MHNRPGGLAVVIFLLIVISGSPAIAEDIPLFTYHTHPPFLTGKGQGLSYDLAQYLTEKSHGRYVFSVIPMSRPRVNKMLAESRSGILPWVNPAWFSDREEQVYAWTTSAIMQDSNAVISHVDRSLVYDGPESFAGLVFGGVRGHVYAEVDDYINATGKAKRVNAENHIDNFRKLLKGRVDATITPSSGAEFYIRQEGIKDSLYISPLPHSRFARRLIVVDRRQDILAFLEEVVAAMARDVGWKQIVSKYR